jgi:PncC family amidohydrolase
MNLVLQDKAARILEQLKEKKLTFATAESCTGGLVSALFTDIPGSSAAFVCGYVAYANAAKTQMLGIDSGIIETRGAVSEEVSRAMALGAREKSGVDIAVSITGIAGPDGGNKEKPVGLVYIAVATKTKTICEKNIFRGDRASVRLQSVEKALMMVESACQ